MMQPVQAEVIVIISASTPRHMQNTESKRIIALGVCFLFLAVPIWGFLSDTDTEIVDLSETKEQHFTNTGSSSININGSEASSIFSNSVLDVTNTGPLVILNNGTSVKWSEGNPIYTEGSLISTSGRCSILSNYSVFCSGSNNYGQLGLGNNGITEGYVSLIQEAIVVDEGKDHTCAILIDASLWCWGRNHEGQIGDNTTVNRASPVQIDLGSGIDAVAVSAGDDYTCALTHTGDVMCWGLNVRGQLGDGTTNNSLVPTLSNHSTNLRAVSLITAGRTTCVLFQNGSVGCWGSKFTVFSDNGPVTSNLHLINLGDNVTANMIDGVGDHTCVVTNNGSMQCWGINTNGQLGDGTCSSTIETNCTAENIFPGEGDSPVNVNFSAGLTVISAATGPHSTCVLMSDDSLQCWGAQSGEFDNTTKSKINPYQLLFTDGTNVAYSDQDLDGDGIRNIFDTHQSGDTDGDGTLDSDDSDPNNPARWLDCSEGKFGRLACNDTDPGHYSTGGLIQIECEPGTFQPFIAQSNCFDSSAGYYVDLFASVSQTPCESGHYNMELGQSSCIASAPGSYVSPNMGDAGDTSDTAVPLSLMSANYTGNFEGNSDSTDVFFLNLSRNNWFIANLTSPAGKNFDIELLNTSFHVIDFSNTSNTHDEVSTISSNNSTGIYFIRITYSSGFNGSDDYNLVIEVKSTDENSTSIGSTSIHVNAEQALYSTPCAPGSWQDQEASSSCNQASPGHYVYGSGATSQNQCAAGYFQTNSGQTGCTIASLGYYVPQAGSTNQIAAGVGHYVNSTGSSGQTSCSIGTYQPSSAQTTCFAANPGYYVPTTGQANQTICSVGTYQPDSGQRICLQADAGHYVPIQGATNQTQCYLGTFQPYGGQWSCTDAAPGHFVATNASISQTACSQGEYQPLSGQISCLQTSSGYYTNIPGSANQQPCLPGYYQPLTGQSGCNGAEPGFYVENQASISQTACLAGSYNPFALATQASDCMLADFGHFVPLPGSIGQIECNPGNFSANLGQITCDSAEPGYFVPSSGADAQIPCSIGTWQGSYGATSCDFSSPGFYVDTTAASLQTACNAGTFNQNSGSNNSADCLSADPGNYVPNPGSSEQILCTAGTYQPAPGQSNCITADFGYHVPAEGATGQIGCLMGSYQANRGGTDCVLAEPGYYVDSHFASSQTACLAGTYLPSSGSTSSNDCIDADRGYFVAENGADSQEACNIGTYQPNEGSSICLIAEPGHYVDTQASSTQTACEAGTFNSDSGSNNQFACLDSELGYYVPESGSVNQIECEVGSYQNLKKQTECKFASLGFFVNSTAAKSQIPAPINFYIDTEGATEPLPCPQGTITLVEGADNVEDCREDYDGDNLPNFLDDDDDNDGVLDYTDLCDYGLMNWISTRSNDWDQDGCEDSAEDSDDDNDGFSDAEDHLPLDPTEWLDTDSDGIGDNADTDDDGDGIPDLQESKIGLDPLIPDFDGDGTCDGPNNVTGVCTAGPDAFPFNPDEQKDTDGDGTGDNSDDFPTLKFYQNYGQAAVHLFIGLIILGVIGFSVRMGIGSRQEKSEADDSTHEVRQIGGVEVRVSAEDRMFSENTQAQVESEPTPQTEEPSSPTMFDLQVAEQTVTESVDESPTSDQFGVDLTIESKLNEEVFTEPQADILPTEVFDELDLESLLAATPPPVPKIEAPPDAQVNEHGQKVWRDDNGDVWVQNPDGSLLKHNVLTGTWEPYEQ